MSKSKFRVGGVSAALVMVGAALLVSAPAGAVNNKGTCAMIGSFATTQTCTVLAGETIAVELKGGNGGAGGAGGMGGDGGAGLTGDSFPFLLVPGGLGALGGRGGLGGSGGKVSGSWLNWTGEDVTLVVTVGSNGVDGLPGASGVAGLDAVVPGPGTDGAPGVDGEAGADGSVSAIEFAGGARFVVAHAGVGGSGGLAGGHGSAGLGDGTPGADGRQGADGVTGADAAEVPQGGWVYEPTTAFEAPFVLISSAGVSDPTVPATSDPWPSIPHPTYVPPTFGRAGVSDPFLLPVCGSRSSVMLLLGLGVVSAGVALLVASRRRLPQGG